MVRQLLILVGSWLFMSTVTARPFTLEIQRNATCNDGETTGLLIVDGQEVGRTLELPWHGNANDVSRVPAGVYAAFIRQDGSRGWRIELRDVPERGNVQLHVGNYSHQTKGCVLLGRSLANEGTSCRTVDSVGAISDVQAAMARASDNGVSSQQLEISVVIRD